MEPQESTQGIIWSGERLAFADLLRGLAAICIVLHHLSLYAPQSDLADQFAPAIGYSLFNHALYAVAVFFVLGGLTASVDKTSHITESSPQTKSKPSWPHLLREILRRYLRLAIPYLAMMGLLIAACTISDWIQSPLNLIDGLSWKKIAAHLFFLQDILGLGNFSAGTWYLCIEFQWSCFVLLLAFLSNLVVSDSPKVKSRSILIRATLLFPIGITSAWYWSRNEAWEACFLYFASQYILGLFLGWNMQNKLPLWALVLYALCIATSLTINSRPQLLVSLMIAGLIWFATRWSIHWKLPRALSWLSDISYSLFLIHYLSNGIVLKAIDPWARTSPTHAATAMMIALFISLLAAHIFHRFVEAPANRWLKKRLS